MQQRPWLIRNLPNLLTASRVFVPIPVWLCAAAMRRGDLEQATLWLVVTGVLVATDFVDGRLARSLGVVSRTGATLDPVLDRWVSFWILALYGWLLFSRGPKLALVVWSLAIAGRLIFEAAALRWARRTLRIGEIPGATWYGKVRFCWECLAVTAGWVLLIWGGPDKYLSSALTLSVLLAVSLYFGWLSLKAYNLGLTATPARSRAPAA